MPKRPRGRSKSGRDSFRLGESTKIDKSTSIVQPRQAAVSNVGLVVGAGVTSLPARQAAVANLELVTGLRKNPEPSGDRFASDSFKVSEMGSVLVKRQGDVISPPGIFVPFSDPRLEFLIGPLTLSPSNGGAVHNWLWLEDNALTTGITLGDNFPANSEPPYPDDRIYVSGLSVTNGSAVVNLPGGGFTGKFSAGQTITILDSKAVLPRAFVINNVNSNTQITLNSNWPGLTQTGLLGSRINPNFTGQDIVEGPAYYDLSKCHHILFHRTGDSRFLTRARKVIDGFYYIANIFAGHQRDDGLQPAPRDANIEGFILRAMDLDALGIPHTLWDWVDAWTEAHFGRWFNNRQYATRTDMYIGVREGAYTLLDMACLAACLPNSWLKVDGTTETAGMLRRATWHNRAVDVAYRYHCRIQWPIQLSMPRGTQTTGAFRWSDFDWPGGLVNVTQPFQSAILVGDALRQVYRLIENNGAFATEKIAIRNAIIKGADDLWNAMRREDEIADIPGKFWKGSNYFWWGGVTANPTLYDPATIEAGYDTHTSDGDVGYNHIEDERALLQDQAITHAFAYRLTGDPVYLARFEYVMDAAWAAPGYPRTDGYVGLQDYLVQPKHFGQGYRSTPQALAYAAGNQATFDWLSYNS